MYKTRHGGRAHQRGEAQRQLLALASLVWLCWSVLPAAAAENSLGLPRSNPSIIRKVSGLSDKLELTTNTSRILTLDKRIPFVQVNNPELLVVTPLSDKQVQISAKKPGVTQVNLKDEDGVFHTIDVLIYGDVSELKHALKTQFPHSSIDIYRYSESLVLKGFVDRPDYVSQITQLAEDYAPKVINNITVGGVQQILLKVQVMEVSRTKLRRLGVDFAQVSGSGGFVSSSISGLISAISQNTAGQLEVATNGAQTFEFGIVDGNNVFFGFLDALQQHNIAKILAEPNLVAVSGRPARFNVGGEIPILVPQSLGTTSIEYKPFGTQVDFLPIVLGNGNIRLEVRPRISEIDASRSVTIQNSVIPALTVREVDTAVEMKAGQTFALAGLIQERIEGQVSGLPFLSDIPILGVPFRKTEEKVNEIELLILVTPEFVDAIDSCEVPCGGPGLETVSPTNADLYCDGEVEVPAYCNPYSGLTSGGTCGPCCSPFDGNSVNSNDEGMIPTEELILPGGTGFDDSRVIVEPDLARIIAPTGSSKPGQTIAGSSSRNEVSTEPTDSRPMRTRIVAEVRAGFPSAVPRTTAPRTYSSHRQPVYRRYATSPQRYQTGETASAPAGRVPKLIGPIGYDVPE